MANTARSGRHIVLYNPIVDYKNPIDSGDLPANNWYMLAKRADANTAIPSIKVGTVFRSKHNGNTTLANGDEVYNVSLGEPVAVTECTLPFSRDSIDVTDNESGAYKSYITSGFTDLSGTITRFTKFKPDGTMDKYSLDMIGRFSDIVEDPGDMQLKEEELADREVLAFICLNSDAQEGQNMYWIVFNMIILSYDVGGGVMDALKGDMNYQKGSGSITLYVRKVGSEDLIRIG